MTHSTVRFGLVGYGAWGNFHADAIAKTEGAELRAISGRTEQTCQAAREAFPDADVYADYRELVRRDDLDVVDIAVPNHVHHQVACSALEAGKHILLEKPMAISVQQCDDILRLARHNQRLVAIGHELRLSSLWGKASELVEEGFVGQPQYVLVELSRNPYRQGSYGWRYDIERVGNWILEEPIHFFDFGTMVFTILWPTDQRLCDRQFATRGSSRVAGQLHRNRSFRRRCLWGHYPNAQCL